MTVEEVEAPMIEAKEVDLKLQFRDFFKTFKDKQGKLKYWNKILDIAIKGEKSLIVDFPDLLLTKPDLALKVLEEPRITLEYASEALKDIVRGENPELVERTEKFYVRFRNLPRTVPIRKLGAEHIERLVQIEGIITRMTPVIQRLYKAVFKCLECGSETEVLQEEETIEYPELCGFCEERKRTKIESRKARPQFKLLLHKSKFINMQKIIVQEKPEDVPPGHMPRSVEVVLLEDLVDKARPGDRVTVVGILTVKGERSVKKGTKLTFEMKIEANSLEVSQKVLEEIEISKEDERKILELAKDLKIREKIVQSIAPAIHGYNHIKKAIALLLFGGVPKELPDGTRIRGDIHILLVGDPGVAKSLVFSEPILYMDSNGYIHYEPIGKLVDKYIEKHRYAVEKHEETEILNLNKIGVNLYTFSVNPLTFKVEIKPIKSLIRHKAPKKVVIVKTKYGRRAIITKDHSLIAYENGLLVPVKPLEALEKKSLIPLLKKAPILRKQLITTIHTNLGEIKLNEDIGYFLGYFLGDGSLTLISSSERIEISSNNATTLNRLKNIVEKYFKVKCKIYESKLNNYRLIVDDAKFVEWIKKNMYLDCSILHKVKKKGYMSRLKKIPEFSYIAPLDYVIGLLSGLIDSDGYVGISDKSTCKEVKISTTSINIVHGITILLTRLGLPYTIRIKETKYKGRKIEYYEVNIVKMEELVKTFDINVGKKILKLRKTREKSSDYVDRVPIGKELLRILQNAGLNKGDLRPIGAEFRGKIYRGYVGRKYGLKILRTVTQLTDIREELLYGLRKIVKNENLMWDTVEEVKEIPLVEIEPEHYRFVYDISVEDNENFVGGLGLLFLHNSQILQYIARIAPRGLYTSGKGSSAAGLTAAVIRDKSTGDYFLEAGALVLADGGICAIDEIDKMRPEDRVAIHEAMEQQTISIAKAGIVARLNARTAILAAGNPKFGRYIEDRLFTENINLPPTILSRFDLIFVMRDKPAPQTDEELVSHILTVHKQYERVKPPIPPSLLRKYVGYARKYVKPRLTEEAAKIISDFFVNLRSKASENPNAPIPITPRQLEAIIRLAEAHARMVLRNEVTAEDAKAAIDLVVRSFKDVGLDIEAGVIDIDIIMTGKPVSRRLKIMKVMEIIEKLEEYPGAEVKKSDVIEQAVKSGLDAKEVEEILDQLRREGSLYEPRLGKIARTM